MDDRRRPAGTQGRTDSIAAERTRGAPPSAGCACGFRVKSGWSIVVLVHLTDGQPGVADRRVVQLSDPDVPASAQPYHAALGVHRAAAARDVAWLRRVVEAHATPQLATLFREYQSASRDLRGAGIVAGSLIDPSTIANEHIRAHAEEGRFFRSIVERAARAVGLEAATMAEKELMYEAVRRLGCSERQIRSRLTELGRGVGPPWRGDEKAATLAAWLALACDRDVTPTRLRRSFSSPGV
jgi:hypothetical protein